MEKKSKKTIIIGITSLFLVMILLLGLTYAYYRTRIIGNQNNESISVVSKLLEITYTDGTAIVNMEGNIEPGFTYTKQFSVENTGNQTVNYGVKLDNITSSFTRTEDWVFTIKKGNEILRENFELPTSESYLVNNVSIASDGIDNYTLIITYKNLTDINQSEDMGKSLSLRVNIDESAGDTFEGAIEGSILASIADDNLIGKTKTIPGKEKSETNAFKAKLNDAGVSRAFSTDKYYTYADSYIFDENGNFVLADPKVGLYSEIYNELEGKYINIYGANTTNEINASASLFFQVTDVTNASDGSLIGNMYEVGVKGTEAVLASTEDDYGTSYYFRGAVNNNYINYSGMCWRIVRVDGNGNVKLVLADENNECNSSGYSKDNGLSAFAFGRKDINYNETISSENDVLFENSDFPEILTLWSERAEKPLDKTYLINAEWCTDTSIKSLEIYGNSGFVYGAGKRIYTSPTLKCDMVGLNDSVASVYSNLLGILSVDEIAFAGVGSNVSNGLDYYLMDNTSGSNYWTLTPEYYWPESAEIVNYIVTSGNFGTHGALHTFHVSYLSNSNSSVRPSVLLKSTAPVSSGNGTLENPYVIS